MRDTNRIPRILEKLRIVWEKFPDFRFGQLHYIINNNLTTSNDFFHVEDDKFEAELDKIIERLDN